MADSNISIAGAVCAVVFGYISAEAATIQLFERLVWPQRAYANVSLRSIPLLAMTPMGGPLYSVALQALNVMFMNGLFKGPQAGHMLGTAFYPDQNWTYTSWASNGQKIKTEPVRDCLWARALSHVPIPSSDKQQLAHQIPEKAPATGTLKADKIRARVAVSHLTFAKATKEDVESTIPFVKADTGRPTIQTFLAIAAAELSAILVAAGVAAQYKSLWSLWWLAPLVLRLISALFSVDRTPLRSQLPSQEQEDICDFEIHCPQYEGNFMLLTGPKSVAEQFFVHYGHPVRDGSRETVQFTVIILFGSLFPLGSLLSTTWMPSVIQKVWLCYQICSGLFMVVMRFSHCGSATSTETIISEHFKGSGGGKTAILFGLNREGSETIKVSFGPTYHDRFLEGQARMNELLRRKS
ncbi:hypothetical protein ACHAPE_002201 [Trichoderma viride]